MPDITEKLLDKADATINTMVTKVSEVVDKHGAEAIQLTAKIIQLQTLKEMLLPIVYGIIAYILYRICRYWILPFSKKYEDESDLASYIPLALVGIVCGVMILVTIVELCNNTLSPLNWAILMDYRVAVASKVINFLTPVK